MVKSLTSAGGRTEHGGYSREYYRINGAVQVQVTKKEGDERTIKAVN